MYFKHAQNIKNCMSCEFGGGPQPKPICQTLFMMHDIHYIWQFLHFQGLRRLWRGKRQQRKESLTMILKIPKQPRSLFSDPLHFPLEMHISYPMNHEMTCVLKLFGGWDSISFRFKNAWHVYPFNSIALQLIPNQEKKNSMSLQ